eukprot:scaffold699_cov231-Pinguiococcus_pyrenoidosus.AAC.15
MYKRRPYVDGKVSFVGGVVEEFGGRSIDVSSPIVDEATGERAVLGRLSDMDPEHAVSAVQAAARAWNRGQGAWPQMSQLERIQAIESVVRALRERRQEIVDVLMWEICKTTKDAEKEFDRTMQFIEASIEELREQERREGGWTRTSGTAGRVRRSPVGVMLALAPFNYPFNEAYATFIPALLMGNTAVMKLPAIGGLAHILTMEAFSENMPPGVVNFVSGSGRKTMGPIMATGLVDIFAFIGGSKAADAILKAHPAPHRVKTFLQLEGKNLGIVTPDADIEVAAREVALGATSYNGQRCTAIKLVLVHESVKDEFLKAFKEKIAELGVGLPWESGVKITPLPEPKKPAYLEELLADAIERGASIINADQGGGKLAGALMTPAVVYPVDKSMRLWSEEQFGPVIPIATYASNDEIFEYLRETPFGQQAAIFTTSGESTAPLIDALSTAVGRININTQCSRGPDNFPFSGRRSSALGTMSVKEALKAFSIETLLAYKDGTLNQQVAASAEGASSFFRGF